MKFFVTVEHPTVGWCHLLRLHDHTTLDVTSLDD